MARGATKQMSRRAMKLVIGLLILGFGTSMIQLAGIQLINGREYKEKAAERYLGDSEVDRKSVV